MLVLTYLKGHPQDSDSQLLRYLISEVFDIFRAHGEAADEELSLYRTIPRYEAPWQMLHQMRDEVGAGTYKGGPNRRRGASPATQAANNPPAVVGPAPVPKSFLATENANERVRQNFMPGNSDQTHLFQAAPTGTAQFLPGAGAYHPAPTSSTTSGASFNGFAEAIGSGNHAPGALNSQENYFGPRRQPHAGQTSRENGPSVTATPSESTNGRAQSVSRFSNTMGSMDEMTDTWLDILDA